MWMVMAQLKDYNGVCSDKLHHWHQALGKNNNMPTPLADYLKYLIMRIIQVLLFNYRRDLDDNECSFQTNRHLRVKTNDIELNGDVLKKSVSGLQKPPLH